MNSTGLITVIITSYNWSLALRTVLSALNQQTDENFEVIIADDGSSEEELAAIREAIKSCRFPVSLIWQEDRGFRAARARNQAAAQARGDYLIFLDGDCVVRRHFIAKHRALAEPGYWVTGNRILLHSSLTQSLLKQMELPFPQTLSFWLLQRLRRRCNRWLALLSWPFSLGRKSKPRSWKGAKTCNLGLWKSDFMAANGFDERYEGWGYEDSDLVIRLIRSGIYRKSGRFALTVFHLWHQENNRALETENLARLQAIIASTEERASLGVDQYG